MGVAGEFLTSFCLFVCEGVFSIGRAWLTYVFAGEIYRISWGYIRRRMWIVMIKKVGYLAGWKRRGLTSDITAVKQAMLEEFGHYAPEILDIIR